MTASHLLWGTVLLLVCFPVLCTAEVSFDAQEWRIIRSLSGEKLKTTPDPTNKFSGNAEAAKFGQALFFDNRLSGAGSHSCASCHHPGNSFSSPHTRGSDNAPLNKHTPHLWNVGANRWYFWDGRADSLWAQAMEPIENEHEMAGSRTAIVHLIRNDADYLAQYQRLFRAFPAELVRYPLPKQAKPMQEHKNHPANLNWKSLPVTIQQDINWVFVNVVKAIAAFEETIISRNSAFDRFVRKSLQSTGMQQEMELSQSALRGLKLFIGKAGCIHCHSGANLTDGEFHHLSLDDADDLYNPGRYHGIKQLSENPFNSRSIYSNAPVGYRHPVDYIYRNSEFRGQFKTPTLRNIAKTAPYMHNAQFQTLTEVINYYNEISKNINPASHKETTLQSLRLSMTEKNDLETFLNSLTDESFLERLPWDQATGGR